AVKTNIGYSHLEKLGTRENIFKAKMEVVEGFDETKILVVNADDDMLETIDEIKFRIELLEQARLKMQMFAFWLWKTSVMMESLLI
ncbi:MAG: hypothetical protein HXL89_05955, partial [[Eubacterium] sulci]|nr:hypothetical protein [[Eubacterium] sulci]